MAINGLIKTRDKGLVRTKLAGDGGSLGAAFAYLKQGAIDYPVVTHSTRQMLNSRIPLTTDEGDGFWELQWINQYLQVVISDYCYVEQRTEQVKGQGLLEFHYRLSGPSLINMEDDDALELNSPAAYLCKFNEGSSYEIRNVPGSENSQINIYCDPEYFRKSFGIDQSTLSRLWLEWINDKAIAAQYFQLQLNELMLQVAKEIITCTYIGEKRLVFIEAKVLELLCLTLDALMGLDEESLIGEVFSDADIEKLERARQILQTEFNPFPTIVQLARRLGTNETKLKRGFRLFFGTTIFELGRRYRLEHALSLLVDKKRSISAVANQVGYKYPSSFAAAFKSHFGILPKDTKKLRVSDARQRDDIKDKKS